MSVDEKVSIIIPVFNAAAFLHKCLISVLNQTYQNLEVILVNDGSVDHSGDICDYYQRIDERVTVFHQNNKGPSVARNVGIQHATGTYLQFIDADDRVTKTMTMELVEAMHTHKSDLVISGYQSGELYYRPPITGSFDKDSFLKHIGLLYKTIILPSPCNKLFRRSIVKHYNIQFDSTRSYGEDLLFNLAYIQYCSSIHLLDKTLYIYEENQHSLTKTYIENMYAKQLDLHRQVAHFLRDNNCLTKENKTYIDTILANGIIHAISNIFHPENPFTKVERKSQLQALLKHPTITKQTPYFNDSLQAKLVRYFIQKRAYRQAYNYFHLKELLRSRWKGIFMLIRRVN